MTSAVWVRGFLKDDYGVEAGDIEWNFEKFLVTPDGAVRRFRPKTKPDDPALKQAIESALA